MVSLGVLLSTQVELLQRQEVCEVRMIKVLDGRSFVLYFSRENIDNFVI